MNPIIIITSEPNHKYLLKLTLLNSIFIINHAN